MSKISKKLLMASIVLAAAAGALWWQRTPLLTWYGLRALAGADQRECGKWVEWVANFDTTAVPGLIDLLRREDAKVCANGEQALSALAKRWGPIDARTTALAEELANTFANLSQPGREAALEWHLALLQCNQHAADAKALASADKMLLTAGSMQDRGVRVRAMALAEMLLGRGATTNVELCRDLAAQGLKSSDVEIRAGAIRLVMHAPLHTDKGLTAAVVPFLKDESPLVRRAAVLAVGLAEETITVQDLLPLLQDGDAEVRRICEAALRGRGLRDNHIRLAKLITDERPGQRLQVVHYLSQAEDLEPGIWLMHLSQDPSPAVRAAAIRYAVNVPAAAAFKDRMLQMSREDASPTVRQLAVFYVNKMQH